MSTRSAQPLVSVVVPTYNRAYCIRRTVDSVLSQTYPQVEVVLVDDGSTDGTADVIAEAYAGERRVRYVHQENAGVSAARNHGIRIASGDFVGLLDSDDLWKPWKLDVQLAGLAAFPEAGMIWTDMEAVDAEGALISSRYLREMYTAYEWFGDDLFSAARRLSDVFPGVTVDAAEGTVYSGDIFSQMVMGNLVHTSTVLLTRERISRVKGFCEDLRYAGEDYDFHLRTCREGPVAFVDVSSIQYRVGCEDQLTRPEYGLHMAMNFLKTVTRTIERDRARITLPPRMIRQVLSEAHAWVGEKYVETGRMREARGYLARSVLRRPRDPRTIGLLLVSALPPSVGRFIQRVVHAVKKGLRGAPVS